MIENDFRDIEQQLEDGDLDMNYHFQFELYKLEWHTERPLENCRNIRVDFGQVDFYDSDRPVATAEQADDVWMRKKKGGKMKHYFSYDEEKNRATAAAHKDEVFPFVNMVADFEQWDELSDKRDQLYILLCDSLRE